jgi:spore germination cell wall hydrolase CwlJ-like protein
MLLKNSKSTLLLLFIALVFAVLMPANNYRTVSLIEQAANQSIEEQLAKIKPVNLEHLKCLATAIYYESKGEPFMGQVAVARVVMNRITHGFGSNPCKVVYQTTKIVDPEDSESIRKLCQFSWVCDGKTTPAKSNIKYRQAEDIARQVLAEDKWHDLMPNNVLFFHSILANPRWVYRRVMTLGNHVFYSK